MQNYISFFNYFLRALIFVLLLQIALYVLVVLKVVGKKLFK